MCLSFNIQNFTKKSVTQVQHTGFHAGTTGRLSLKSAKGMIRPCSRPASECWQGSPKTRRARHVTENSTLRRRNRHRYRQELVPHRWPESARCHPPVPAKIRAPLSALPLRTDIDRQPRHVCKVPQNEPAHAGGAGGAVKRLRLPQ